MNNTLDKKYRKLAESELDYQLSLEALDSEIRLYKSKLIAYDALLNSGAVSEDQFPEGEIEALQFLLNLSLQRFTLIAKKLDQVATELDCMVQ